jgi:hypothetical protein
MQPKPVWTWSSLGHGFCTKKCSWTDLWELVCSVRAVLGWTNGRLSNKTRWNNLKFVVNLEVKFTWQLLSTAANNPAPTLHTIPCFGSRSDLKAIFFTGPFVRPKRGKRGLLRRRWSAGLGKIWWKSAIQDSWAAILAISPPNGQIYYVCSQIPACQSVSLVSAHLHCTHMCNGTSGTPVPTCHQYPHVPVPLRIRVRVQLYSYKALRRGNHTLIKGTATTVPL